MLFLFGACVVVAVGGVVPPPYVGAGRPFNLLSSFAVVACTVVAGALGAAAILAFADFVN